MDDKNEVKVKWIKSGYFFTDGKAEERGPGDDDTMPKSKAKKYVGNGYVVIVENAEIPKVDAVALKSMVSSTKKNKANK